MKAIWICGIICWSYAMTFAQQVRPDFVACYEREVGKWKKDIEKFERLDRMESYAEDSVIFLGSSSIRLWNTLAEDVASYPVIRRGFGGSKFSDWAWYIDRVVSSHSFRAAVIFVANDVKGEERDKNPEILMPLVKYVVERIHLVQPEAPVLFIAITPTEKRWKLWPQIAANNRAIEDWCETSERLHFISTASYFMKDNDVPNPALFVDDKLHLNRDGYRLWGRLVTRAIDRALK